MVLVDTSVWIPFLRGDDTKGVDKFLSILNADIPFGITLSSIRNCFRERELSMNLKISKNI